ncbi:MAG: hypothetical protein ACTHJS_10710, partial [Xanthobacteraceae bacterium]
LPNKVRGKFGARLGVDGRKAPGLIQSADSISEGVAHRPRPLQSLIGDVEGQKLFVLGLQSVHGVKSFLLCSRRLKTRADCVRLPQRQTTAIGLFSAIRFALHANKIPVPLCCNSHGYVIEFSGV